MSRKSDKNIINKAIDKINGYGLTIIESDEDTILYVNKDGLKEKKHKYAILRNSFSPFAQSLRDCNEFCVCNANILASKNNPYNTKVVSIEKQIATLQCGCCNSIYTQQARHFVKEECEKVCPNCYQKIHVGKRKDEQEVFEIIRGFGFQILPNQHYKEMNIKIGVKDEFGYKGEMCFNNILKGSKISPFAKYNSYALENIRHYCKENGIEATIPNQKYNGLDAPFKVQCSCGRMFTTSVTHFIHDNKTYCDYCTGRQSKYECIIEEWLKLNGVSYIKQYRYKDCVYKQKLPFDFYIPSINTLIEVDGEGHFYPIRYNGTSKEKAEKCFKDTQKRDKIKNKYCSSHNIPLLRIPYFNIKDGKYKFMLQNLFVEK